jgi:hypothetical protein
MKIFANRNELRLGTVLHPLHDEISLLLRSTEFELRVILYIILAAAV